jgi:hypothetical protein
MAGLGHREWIPGEIITADNVQGYLQDQAVQVYATTAARGSALAIPTEGMVAYLKDAGAGQERIEYFDGGSWKPLVFIPNNASVSASTAISAANSGGLIVSTAGSSITITVPDVLGLNERVDILRDGAGLVNIAAGTGVTTWAGGGVSGTATVFSIDEQYSAASVLKVGANSYRVVGKIIA